MSNAVAKEKNVPAEEKTKTVDINEKKKEKKSLINKVTEFPENHPKICNGLKKAGKFTVRALAVFGAVSLYACTRYDKNREISDLIDDSSTDVLDEISNVDTDVTETEEAAEETTEE